MNNHKGKVFTIANFTLQPFTTDIQDKIELIENGLLDLFSDKKITRYNPNLQMTEELDVLNFMVHVSMSYQHQGAFTYFLFDNEANRMIGIVQLISNKVVLLSYPTHVNICEMILNMDKNNLWAIEFYLNCDYWNRGIMSMFVDSITNELFMQGVETVIAITNRENSASISLLKKCNYTLLDDYVDITNQVLWYRQN